MAFLSASGSARRAYACVQALAIEHTPSRSKPDTPNAVTGMGRVTKSMLVITDRHTKEMRLLSMRKVKTALR
jgi:hypothetical protein